MEIKREKRINNNERMKQDFSVECAKAYGTDSGDEASLAFLKSLNTQLGQQGKTASLVLLVDDTSYENKAFDFDSYGKWLEKGGVKPDLVFKESDIIPVYDEVLKIIDFNKLSPVLAEKVHLGECTSQIFIVAWFLLRLGYISSSNFDEKYQAKNIFNILPESFKAGEDEVLEIIKATPFREAVDKVEYKFIEF